jgi:RNA polymerase sigma factor (sigma-70 family)
MPKGLLLSGRPGTGKTFLAACIASEANLPFIYIDASSLRGMFMGMTEMMVAKLFRDARGLARKYAEKGKRGACIVFMDEIDSIGVSRGGQGGGMGMGMMGGMFGGGSQGLNTLLNQMDSLGDFVEDRQTLSPADAAMALSLEEQTRKVLATLTPREEQILRLRFGIGEKSDYTLEEVGQRFAVTRERIRQIEAKALRKLRSPNRARSLETFVQRQ